MKWKWALNQPVAHRPLNRAGEPGTPLCDKDNLEILNTEPFREVGCRKKYMTFRTKKTLVIGLMSIGILSFILKLILFFYLQGNSPRIPNISTFQIYPLNNHGYIFYVTKIQSLVQDILFDAFFLFAVGSAILEIRWKTIRNQFEEIPKELRWGWQQRITRKMHRAKEPPGDLPAR